MRVFQVVVDEGSFAAAARKMDLDPAVVTRLVLDLEKHLGARLLQRTTRRVALTPAGQEYSGRLRTILAEIDEADASVQGQAGELRGRLRILAPAVVATHMLAPAIEGFLRRYPDIHVDLRVLDAAAPPIEEYDLTFLNGATQVPADIVVREVTASDAVLCAAPSYLKRHGVPRQAQDLHSHHLLRLCTAGGRLAPLRLTDPSRDGAELVIDVPAALTADHTDTLLRATLDGAGISSQPADIAAPFLKAGQLQRVLAPLTSNRLSLVAAYPSRKFLAARARVFLEHVIEHLRANGVPPPAAPRSGKSRRG